MANLAKTFERSLIIFAVLALCQACNLPVGLPVSITSQSPTLEPQELAQPTQGHNVFIPAVQSGGGTKTGVKGTPGVAATLDAGMPTEAAFDPHVEVTADHTALKVGDILTITGVPIQISNPSYEVNVRDPGVENIPSLAKVTYNNQVTPLDGSSGVLEFVSAEGGLEQVTFVLRAKAPGTTTVTVIATGEIHNPGAGQASWIGQGEGTLDITVTN
jgi:hypothetical protein